MTHLSYGDIATASDVERFGTFDYATPINWMMEDSENRREFCWWYPSKRRPGKMCGRPLSYRALARLALREARKQGVPDMLLYAKLWAYAHPGRPLDRAGIDSIRKILAEDPHLAGTVGYVLRRLQVPEPPPGTFDPPGRDLALAA